MTSVWGKYLQISSPLPIIVNVSAYCHQSLVSVTARLLCVATEESLQSVTRHSALNQSTRRCQAVISSTESQTTTTTHNPLTSVVRYVPVTAKVTMIWAPQSEMGAEMMNRRVRAPQAVGHEATVQLWAYDTPVWLSTVTGLLTTTLNARLNRA